MEILVCLFVWRGFRKPDALSAPAGNAPAG
jgi:hypothetical protein